jgi:adenosylmethionine-8-amino-7-oxononanoate aminotransferase
LHGFSNPAALFGEGPPLLVHSHRVFVEDEAGLRYLDAIAALWCTSRGFSGSSVARSA